MLCGSASDDSHFVLIRIFNKGGLYELVATKNIFFPDQSLVNRFFVICHHLLAI